MTTPKELQIQIADFTQEHGVELTIKVLCKMLSIIAKNTGPFETADDEFGATVSVDIPEDV